MPHHQPSPSWNHPLFGADPYTLARALAGNGPLPPRVWPLAGALLAASVARAPLSLCERILAAMRLRGVSWPEAPVFILGHWRSGTTHLFNLMSRDSGFAPADPFAAGLPWDFLLLGRLMRPFLAGALPGNRFVDDIAVEPDSPQEDEIGLASMQNISYYHGIYFPRRFERHYRQGIFLEEVSGRELARWRRRFEYYNRKVLAGGSGGTLLVKNPVYTGRVALIRKVWPDARFIHIHRNPYEVFASTRKFYRALLPRFALQAFEDEIADGLIAETYPRMVEDLYEDVRDLGIDRFVEVRFEDLEREPLNRLEHVYTSLAIPGFSELTGEFQRYLDSIADYKKNKHVFTDEIIEAVDRHWGGLVRRWGYRAPD